MIVDATVSNGVAYFLRRATEAFKDKPWLAQIATDVKTATLGLLTVVAPGDTLTLDEVDRNAGFQVEAEAALERFEVFWKDPAPGDELIPAPGCSIPTFHGAAADVAGVAASFTTLLGQQILSGDSGTHLIALPQAGGSGPAHRYIPAKS